MKPSNFSAKGTAHTLFNGRLKVLGLLGGLVLAGAAATVATPTASGQQFGVAVQFGGSRYVAPAPRGYSPYAQNYGQGNQSEYGQGYEPSYEQGYGSAYIQRERAERIERAERMNQWRAQQWRAQQWRAHEDWEHGRDFGRATPDRGW